MENSKKSYSGTIKDEESAAKLYDKLAIKNLGLLAKTNFDYNKRELIEIIEEFYEELNLEEDYLHKLKIQRERVTCNQNIDGKTVETLPRKRTAT